MRDQLVRGLIGRVVSLLIVLEGSWQGRNRGGAGPGQTPRAAPRTLAAWHPMSGATTATHPTCCDWSPSGSVDDGKSTLIGRLLYDTKSIMQDQLDEVAALSASLRRVAWTSRSSPTACEPSASRASRSTSPIATSRRPRRRFILADAPGHVQYTRNMVTGALTANASLVLVDARTGVLEQTRRHAFIASLLHIPHLVMCINKMDLVDWSERVYDEIVQEFSQFAGRIDVCDVMFIPVSAREATTSSSRRAACRGTRARRCSTTSSTSISPPTTTSWTRDFRFSG